MLALCFSVIAVVPTPNAELHVVGLYESTLRVQGQTFQQKAAVLVNCSGKDVTLVLSAYEPVTWQVVVGKGTNLTKVILAGYHTQAVEGPKGVEVVEAFYKGREQRANKDYFYPYYNIDSDRFRTSAQATRKFTGMELSSQGSYNYDGRSPSL